MNMRNVTLTILFLLAATGSALAGQHSILFTQGNAWETGGFPTSEIGDELQAVGILTDIDTPLVWNTALYSYTWWIRGLISTGESVNGQTHMATYTGGEFTIYVDTLPSNHDYGTNPPNATVPSTFTDGTSTYLEGTFTGFTLTHNDVTATGGFTGELVFTGGDVFPLLENPGGWTFGANISGFSPDGYDLEINGQVFLQGPSPVETSSWGGIKGMYR
jgi:hypothetical protein